MLEKQKIINEIISKNVEAIERIDLEIAKKEKEVSENDSVQMDQSDKEVEIVKKYKLTKCRYFDQGFCKYRKKCRQAGADLCQAHAKFI